MADETPLSTFWQPRHGQWVLCDVGLPYSHLTASGKAVGIYQQADVVLDPATRQPYLHPNGLAQMNPPFVIPVDKHGRNVEVDRLNYADLKGYEVLIPGKGICHIGLGAEGAAVDKFFSDNPRTPLNLVLSIQEARIVGPLLDNADLPPGREIHPGWKPVEARSADERARLAAEQAEQAKKAG